MKKKDLFTRGIFLYLMLVSLICNASDCEPMAGTITILKLADCQKSEKGTLSASISGGCMPYTYIWSNGIETKEANNLYGGEYKLTVYDSEGTKLELSKKLPDNSGIEFDLILANPSCYNSTNGSIELKIKGDTNNYTFEWTDGETGNVRENLSSGDYNVTISNQTCGVNYVYKLENPQFFDAQVKKINNPTCEKNSKGSIELEILQGTGEFRYRWTLGDTFIKETDSPILFDAEPGIYSVEIIDINECSKTLDAIEVGQNNIPEIAIKTLQNVSQNGGTDGKIEIEVSGGVEPYAFQWSNGETCCSEITNLRAGCYDCSVIDAAGCKGQISNLCLTEPSSPEIPETYLSFFYTKKEYCYGETITINDYVAKNITNFKWDCDGEGELINKESTSPSLILDESTTKTKIVLSGWNSSNPEKMYYDTLEVIILPQLEIEYNLPNYHEKGEPISFSYDIYGGFGTYSTEITPSSLIKTIENFQVTTIAISEPVTLEFKVTDLDTYCSIKQSIKLTPSYGNPTGPLEIKPLNWISVNNDGINDKFVIEGIENYPENEVKIYNRWGDLVVEYVDYDNQSMVWQGYNYNDKLVVSGTYFYLIEVNNHPPVSGWIQVTAQ